MRMNSNDNDAGRMADEDDENTVRPSPDDALEPPDDIFNPAVDEERLEEDHDAPAEPAHPHLTTPKMPPDHPAGDTGVDFQELYDEGPTSATDVDAQEEAEDHEQTWPLEPKNNEEPEENQGRPG